MVQTKLNLNNKNPPIILLFDIDGTLVRGSKLHVRTFIEIILQEFHFHLKTDWAETSGKTDSWILHDLLIENGIDQKIVNERLPILMEQMGKYYENHLHEEEGYVLPGVNQLLNLLEREHIIMGLVTGNIEAIAYAKLKKLGITHKFEFGGFGHEDFDRSVFMRYAVERAIRMYNLNKDRVNGNVFYIGDTPRDVTAARNANVKSIITLTGIFKRDAFSQNLPDLFIENFGTESEVTKFLNFIKKIH
jgi:phosphoglycolate phosphatase